MNGKYIRLAQSLAQKKASLSVKEAYKVPKEGVKYLSLSLFHFNINIPFFAFNSVNVYKYYKIVTNFCKYISKYTLYL